MSEQLPPVCDFLCGEQGPNNPNYERCNFACQAISNCALTPNILYTFVDGVISNSNLFLSGAVSLIETRISHLAFRLAIYQQIPWLIGFIIIMIVLTMTGTIYTSTGIILFIVALLIAGLIIYLSVVDTNHTLRTTFQDARMQIISDYTNSKGQIEQKIAEPLLEAVVKSRVPCQSNLFLSQ